MGLLPGNAFGALASAFLAHQRGEHDVPRAPMSLPHHQRCKVCGFDRWDGQGEHAWGGTRFAPQCSGVARHHQALAQLAPKRDALQPIDGTLERGEGTTEPQGQPPELPQIAATDL